MIFRPTIGLCLYLAAIFSTCAHATIGDSSGSGPARLPTTTMEAVSPIGLSRLHGAVSENDPAHSGAKTRRVLDAISGVTLEPGPTFGSPFLPESRHWRLAMGRLPAFLTGKTDAQPSMGPESAPEETAATDEEPVAVEDKPAASVKILAGYDTPPPDPESLSREAGFPTDTAKVVAAAADNTNNRDALLDETQLDEWSWAILDAMDTDPRIRSAMSMVESRTSDVRGAYAAYLPTVSGTGSLGDITNEDPLVRSGKKDVLGLEIAQPIPLFGKEKAVVKSAKATLWAEKTELGRIRQEVLFEILDTAVQAASLKKVHELRLELEQNMSAQAKGIRSSVRGGGARLTDLGLVRGRLSQATARRANAEADAGSAVMRLASLVPRFEAGRMLREEIQLNELGIQIPPSLDDALTQAMAYSVVVSKAQAEMEKARAERDIARAERWPKLTVNAQWQRGSFGDVSADSRALFLGLNIPFFEGGARRAATRSANYRYEAARETLTQEMRDTEQQVRELWARWQALQSTCISWELSVAEQSSTLGLTRQQMAGGGATSIDVLRAKAILLESRIQGVERRMERDRVRLRLLSKIGLLILPMMETTGA
uniref:Outer membrane protein TolC n=1 Tax=Candidatus Kentrum sp. DK TaxID=2126562 RepID=A0A450SXN5_9GAMM|nr:MAG: Outer membrane protein TolC [Candidatus Kentron sp. DK]